MPEVSELQIFRKLKYRQGYSYFIPYSYTFPYASTIYCRQTKGIGLDDLLI